MSCEEINFDKSNPIAQRFRKFKIKIKETNFSHLDNNKKGDVKMLIFEYQHLFPVIPTRTDTIYHGVDIENCKLVKHRPYRMDATKLELHREVTSINWIIIILNKVKTKFSLYFCIKRQMELFACVLTIGKLIL